MMYVASIKATYHSNCTLLTYIIDECNMPAFRASSLPVVTSHDAESTVRNPLRPACFMSHFTQMTYYCLLGEGGGGIGSASPTGLFLAD
jgi:hypothetical protein